MLAQLLAVIFDPVWIIIVVRSQELVPFRLLGHDHIAQVVVGIFLIAEEVDPQHATFRAFVNLKDEIDTLLRQFHHLGRNSRRNPARAAIEFDDPLHVLLDL